MLILLRAFWGLCTFRVTPQDIPRSGWLLNIVVLINIVLSTIINTAQFPAATAVLVALLEIGVLSGLTAALLFYCGKMPRYVQTLTALMGSGAIIGAVVLVLFVGFPALPGMLRLTIFLWNLLVMAHILRHALEIHIAATFFIAIGYAVLLIQVIIFTGRLLGAPAS